MEKQNVANLALLFLVGIIGGLISSYSYVAFNSKLFSPVSINKVEEKTYIQENVALEKGIETTQDSLVSINTGKGVLTGIIITNDGLVAVANHDLKSGNKLSLPSKEEVEYNIVKNDNDIAILKINKNQLKPVEFFDFEKMQVGKRLYSLSILSNGSSTYYSANEGIIKNIELPIRTSMVESEDISGSPIFDIENRLIGLANKDEKGNIIVMPSTKIRSLAGLD
ncbi:MAG: serine protease [Candidatus Pacebacteria bacterium]|nr:serine protease [Candidatus Paceibacterota bacterium]